ncbi:MAG: Clp protease N-terminal domain-containing protein, partial [Candidatus Nanopelagicales bacterium]
MDIKFTTKAQDALGAAVRIAAAKGNAQVEPVHILDSLLQQGEGIATALLDAVEPATPGGLADGTAGHIDRAALTTEVRAAVDALPSASGSSVSAPQLSQQSYAVVNRG